MIWSKMSTVRRLRNPVLEIGNRTRRPDLLTCTEIKINVVKEICHEDAQLFISLSFLPSYLPKKAYTLEHRRILRNYTIERTYRLISLITGGFLGPSPIHSSASLSLAQGSVQLQHHWYWWLPGFPNNKKRKFKCNFKKVMARITSHLNTVSCT